MSITISNPKKERNPFIDRSIINVPDVTSYSSRRAKTEGYEIRMQYHSKDCFSKGGKLFNTTLTYNDKALHKYYGYNVPSYDDLRWLLKNGTFTKKLKRDYGVSDIDYFVGTELGEGKGKRGYHNNPHYHIIWFLYPDKDNTDKFDRLNGDVFLKLVRSYWQGTYYQFEGKKLSYQEMMNRYDKKNPVFMRALNNPKIYQTKEAKLGIVSSGRYGCEIKDKFGMNTYVCKYAAKDITAISRENGVYQSAYEKYLKDYETCDDGGYYDSPEAYAHHKAMEDLRYFRNHHSCRVHCSQHLGETAKNAIDDYMNPLVPYTSSKGITMKKLPQYIFRKVYRTLNHNKSYVKNELGKRLEIKQKEDNCKRLMERAVNSYSFFKELDIYKYSKILRNYDEFSYGELDLAYIEKFDNNINNIYNTNWYDNIFNKYATYKTYYEGLSFDIDEFDGVLSPMDDFLLSSNKEFKFEEQADKLYPYSALEFFDTDLHYFNIIDDIIEIKNKVLDEQNREKKEEQDRIRQQYNDLFIFNTGDFDNCSSLEFVL